MDEVHPDVVWVTEPDTTRKVGRSVRKGPSFDGGQNSASPAHRDKAGGVVWSSTGDIQPLQALGRAQGSVRRDDPSPGRPAAIAPVGTFRIGPDGVILDADATFGAFIGQSHEDVIGRPLERFLGSGGPDGERVRRMLGRIGSGAPEISDLRCVGRDGREVELSVTFVPLPACAGGGGAAAVGYASDVSAARLRLAETQSRLDAIDGRHCVVSIALDGTVLDANAHFLAVTGYTLNGVVGRHHRMFVDPREALGRDYAMFWRALAAGEVQAGQYRRLGHGGREIWLQATYTPVLGPSGRPTHIVAHAVAITDDKLLLARYQSQIEAIHKSQCVIAFDLGGIVRDANDKFLDTMGYRFGEVSGQHHRMFCAREDYASADYAAFWSRLGRGEPQTGEYRRIRRDGREVWFQASYNPILDLNGRPVQVVKYATDITAQKMRQADFEGQIAATTKSQGIVSIAMDGTISDMNALFLDALGYTLDEVRGRHHSMLLAPEDAGSPDYRQFWDTLRAGTFVSGLYKRIGKDGRERWIRATYNPILDLAGRPYRIVKHATDVTSDVALAEAYETAKRQALVDPATLLPTRARILAELNEILAEPGRRVTVLCVALDDFGTATGSDAQGGADKVLAEIADRLRRSLAADQSVGRIGGADFAIAVPDLGDDAVEDLCRTLLDAVAVPVRLGGAEIRIHASIGVASAPSDATTPDELIRSADLALQRARQGGRGLFSVASARTSERVAARRRHGEAIRRGLERGEFVLEYQPRFDLARRRMRAVEALVRWNHPEHGRVAPAHFIPDAERTGLIVPLGEWILGEACRAAAGWSGIGVSVNVSPVQFRDGRLPAIVADTLASSGLAPERLELEVTEGVLQDDPDRTRAMLLDLKAMGVRLAMDDFGTGYSSLAHLRRFPFDMIKIDRSFVADSDAHGGGSAVIAAILGLGRALNLSVTAEGVETEQQLAMLIEARCEEAQGFLLARPMPAEQVTAFLQAETAMPPKSRTAPARRGEPPGPAPLPLSA